MGTPKAIATEIRNADADHVLALKGNHESVREEVGSFLREARRRKFKGVAHDYWETVEGDHGRIETRRYGITDAIGWWRGPLPVGAACAAAAWLNGYGANGRGAKLADRLAERESEDGLEIHGAASMAGGFQHTKPRRATRSILRWRVGSPRARPRGTLLFSLIATRKLSRRDRWINRRG